jgi:hypothetical protein
VTLTKTGVRGTHAEFEGRVLSGIDVTADNNGVDGHGHGTHVAATVAGKTYGVAKKASIVPVKVLDTAGSGSIAGKSPDNHVSFRCFVVNYLCFMFPHNITPSLLVTVDLCWSLSLLYRIKVLSKPSNGSCNIMQQDPMQNRLST